MRGFDRLSAVDASQRLALRGIPAVLCGCRPEGRRSSPDRDAAASRPSRLARLTMRGFDRLSAVDASQRLALRGIPAVLCGCRPEGRRSPSPDRDAAASRSSRPARLAMRGFGRLSAVDASQRLALRGIPAVLCGCRPEGRRSPSPDLDAAASRPSRPARLAMRGLDRLSAVDASQRLALRGVPAVLCGCRPEDRRSPSPDLDAAASRPSRLARLTMRGFDRLSAVDASQRLALRGVP